MSSNPLLLDYTIVGSLGGLIGQSLLTLKVIYEGQRLALSIWNLFGDFQATTHLVFDTQDLVYVSWPEAMTDQRRMH